jgi:hypothetical protein
MDNDELELENTIKALIDRIRAAPEGSAEYCEAERELSHLLDSKEDAGLIAEEYQSLLNTIVV